MMFKYILTLLVLMSIVNNIPAESVTINLDIYQKTIYVDDDNIYGPWDGTKEHPYKTINDGIFNATDGDTIYVLNGTYYEKINISKSIFLIGEDKYTTFIDGTYIEPDPYEFGASIIRIFSADKITVSGFTIQNIIKDTFSVDAGFHIEGDSHYDIISNNIIKDIINAGILLSGTNHLISENILMNCAQGIWYIPHYDGCSNSIIRNNTITKIHYEGIQLDMADGNNILNNNITKTRQGLSLLESSKNLIKRNNIANNAQGLFLTLSSRNKFYENNFIDSDIGGHVKFNGWSFLNIWRRNYWDNQIIHILPKILFGKFGLIMPWIKFDWRPARKPYEI